MHDLTINEQAIQDKIYTIRGAQVMLDRDLAELYGVDTKRINEAVKNNQEKFQEDFFFALSDDEFNHLRSKISTANFSKIRVNPKVFTEQGVYMLATILKSKTASQTTVFIIKTFASMKIYTKTISKQLGLDLQKHNAQYPNIEVEKFDLSHDRFLVVDEKEVYHFGASLKDLGKKWFAVSKMDIDSFEFLGKLK